MQLKLLEQGSLHNECILGYGGIADPHQRNRSEPNSVGVILAPRGISNIEFLIRYKESIIPFYKAVGLAFSFAGRGELLEVAQHLTTIAKVGKQHGLRGLDKLIHHLELYALGSHYKRTREGQKLQDYQLEIHYCYLDDRIDEIISDAPLDRDTFRKVMGFKTHLLARKIEGKIQFKEIILYLSGKKPITKLPHGNYSEGEIHGLYIDSKGRIFIPK